MHQKVFWDRIHQAFSSFCPILLLPQTGLSLKHLELYQNTCTVLVVLIKEKNDQFQHGYVVYYYTSWISAVKYMITTYIIKIKAIQGWAPTQQLLSRLKTVPMNRENLVRAVILQGLIFFLFEIMSTYKTTMLCHEEKWIIFISINIKNNWQGRR